ncbi:hypothetical protein L1987_63244 [Smallanthus sonchifolius]|uniref:Uncharacterized protein n=1 Tax=Smallanthus sonchifolius TaxID=185202 RepID=A0ACB9CCK9_9ASTR|nr:hypothetical protein L1987_63244 [Smallanthus sonchifolius]
MNTNLRSLHLLLILSLLQSPPSSAVNFIINSFNSTSISLYGNATIQSNILTLTTSPATDSRTVDGNSSNHVSGVEFDVFRNEEFRDINDNHVGIDVNSLTSFNSSEAGYYEDEDGGFRVLQLNNGRNYQVWIDYKYFMINVTMAPVGVNKPTRCLICVPLNLSDVYEDEMYVGFTASTGTLTQSHNILSWSFSNSDFSLSDGLVTENLPSFVLPDEGFFKSKGFVIGLVSGVFFALIGCGFVTCVWIKRKRRIAKEKGDLEDWELEYWPHRIAFQDVDLATKSFSDENVIGIGGNGKVYKGVLGGVEIAVKRISHDNDDVVQEFLAEVSSLGRLKHKNLVGLRGWCKKEKGSLILVYDYMENGSLDKMLFDCKDYVKILNFNDRMKILKDITNGIWMNSQDLWSKYAQILNSESSSFYSHPTFGEDHLVATAIWEGQEMMFERVVKIQMDGIPIVLREEKTFLEFAGLFGKVIEPFEFSWDGFDISSGACLVLHSSERKIDEEVNLIWNNRSYPIWVKEVEHAWPPALKEPSATSTVGDKGVDAEGGAELEEGEFRATPATGNQELQGEVETIRHIGDAAAPTLLGKVRSCMSGWISYALLGNHV